MTDLFKIDKTSNLPVYRQIINAVISRIEDGNLSLGAQLPSINQVATDYGLARETVVKAFKILQEKGTISPVHGKGYFVSSVECCIENRIFVLFDTFSAYKEVIFTFLKDSAGTDTFIDIYFHHYNFKVFEKTILDSVGKYHSYIVIPMENERLNEVLAAVPLDKLYLLDIKPDSLKGTYSGIFQNFEEDIFNAMSSELEKCRKYTRLNLVFRNLSTDPPSVIIKGFERFCNSNKLNYKVIRTALSSYKLNRGEAYMVIDDEDLVFLVEQAKALGLIPGTDFGILSYNETPFKKIAAYGISVISTDFAVMGTKIAEMVINHKRDFLYNEFRFIDRGSF